MEPAIIQKLILCSQKKLSTAAEELNIPIQRAKVVRDHWIRRITSRCVKCNTLVPKDLCQKCKTPKQSPRELLQKIKPKEVILRRDCQCGKPFYYSAGYILEMFEKRGTFKPSRKCEDCRTGVKKTKPQKKKVPPKKKVIHKKQESKQQKSKKVRSIKPKKMKSQEPKKGLTYRPFQALEGLKVKNQGRGLG